MKFRIPKSITLRGRRWRIIRPGVCTGGEDTVGCCRHADRTIEIRAGLSDGQVLETFLHECLHAVFPHSLVSDEVQEAIIDNTDEGLADAVYALLR